MRTELVLGLCLNKLLHSYGRGVSLLEGPRKGLIYLLRLFLAPLGTWSRVDILRPESSSWLET